MKRDEEDVETAAQSGSKEDNNYAPSCDNFDFDYEDVEHSYNSWPIRYRYSLRHHWYRLQSIPLPNWLPIRKLNQLNPRYLALIFALSLAVTVLIVNPYGPPIPALDSSSIIPSITGHNSNETDTSLDPEFCTTWPVDEDGNYTLNSHDRPNQVESYSIAPHGGWRKPAGVKVIAMVFFGRKRYVDILDCYLRQNLASNGGYLDEVWFMVHTEEEEDLAWLDGLVKDTKDYKKVGEEDCKANDHKYGCLWKYATAANTMYIKLDDDIVSFPICLD